MGLGKNFWLGRIRKRASPAENQEEKLRESIACENSHLAGPRPLYFTQNTRKTPKSTFPKLKGDRCTSSRTLNQRRLELWVGGRAECEPRATPLSTRSSPAEHRSLGSPFFSFSVVPPGRPPPFPTVREFRIFVSVFSSFPPFSTQKNTFQKPGEKTRLPTQPTLGDLL